MMIVLNCLISLAVATSSPFRTKGVLGSNNCIKGQYGYEVCLKKGDLTADAVDAVVNAANEHLSHGGGVAAALVRAGGEVIQTDSTAHVAKFGSLPVSHTAVTTAGAMPAKYIIHVVGPVFDDSNPNKSDGELREAVLNTLRTARRMCLNSVAMPLLSSGIFGYPKRRAAAVVLSSIFEYYEKRDLAAPAESVKGRLPDTVECNLAASAVPRFVTLMDVDREAFDALVTEMRKFAKFQSSFRRTEL